MQWPALRQALDAFVNADGDNLGNLEWGGVQSRRRRGPGVWYMNLAEAFIHLSCAKYLDLCIYIDVEGYSS